jgi:hypothetical protein
VRFLYGEGQPAEEVAEGRVRISYRLVDFEGPEGPYVVSAGLVLAIGECQLGSG